MRSDNSRNLPVSQLRLLLWLKVALTWRGYRNNRSKQLNILVLLLAFVPVSAFAAFGLYLMLTESSDALSVLIARDALAILFLLWVLSPLIGFQLNESYDLTKLFVYPIGYGEIFLGSFLGSLIDTTVLLTLPPLGVLVWQFSPDLPTAFAAMIVAILFLLSTVALGQAITLALVGFLRSRRFRDITIVLFPIFGLAYYIAQQTLLRHLFHAPPEKIISAPAWRLADWMPPGYTAQALRALELRSYVPAFGWMTALAAWIGITVYAASNTLKRLYIGDAGRMPGVLARSSNGSSSASAPSLQTGRGFGKPWLSLLNAIPREVGAVTEKELVYLVRDPQYKAMAVQLLYTMMALAIPILLPSYQVGKSLPNTVFQGWALLGVGAALLLSMAPLVFNIFGGEGAAITVLFSLPTRRRNIFLGKNLAHLAVLALLGLVGMTVISAGLHQWAAMPLALLTVIIAAPVLMAAGNLISVRLPHRMLVRGHRWQKGGASMSGGNAGCLYALAYMAAYTATIITLIPVAAAALLPQIAQAPSWLYLITMPLAALYSITLYMLLLGTAESWLLSREPEIAARVVPDD